MERQSRPRKRLTPQQLMSLPTSMRLDIVLAPGEVPRCIQRPLR